MLVLGIGLEVNADKTKYVDMSPDQDAGQSHNVKTESVEEFKYLGTTLTKQNSLQEGIKRRLKSGYACYHLVQNILSSSLISKNFKIKIHGTKILLVVLYGCETGLLTLREQHRLRVLEKRVLRRIFGSQRDELIE